MLQSITSPIGYFQTVTDEPRPLAIVQKSAACLFSATVFSLISTTGISHHPSFLPVLRLDQDRSQNSQTFMHLFFRRFRPTHAFIGHDFASIHQPAVFRQFLPRQLISGESRQTAKPDQSCFQFTPTQSGEPQQRLERSRVGEGRRY